MLTRFHRPGARALAALLALQLAGGGPAVPCAAHETAAHEMADPGGEHPEGPSEPCDREGSEEAPRPECFPGPLCLTSLPGPAQPGVPILAPDSEAAVETPAPALKPAPAHLATPPPKS